MFGKKKDRIKILDDGSIQISTWLEFSLKTTVSLDSRFGKIVELSEQFRGFGDEVVESVYDYLMSRFFSAEEYLLLFPTYDDVLNIISGDGEISTLIGVSKDIKLAFDAVYQRFMSLEHPRLTYISAWNSAAEHVAESFEMDLEQVLVDFEDAFLRHKHYLSEDKISARMREIQIEAREIKIEAEARRRLGLYGESTPWDGEQA